MQDDISPLSLRRFPLREQSYWSTQENTHGITPERACTEWQVDPPWHTVQVSFDPKKCSQERTIQSPLRIIATKLISNDIKRLPQRSWPCLET